MRSELRSLVGMPFRCRRYLHPRRRLLRRRHVLSPRFALPEPPFLALHNAMHALRRPVHAVPAVPDFVSAIPLPFAVRVVLPPSPAPVSPSLLCRLLFLSRCLPTSLPRSTAGTTDNRPPAARSCAPAPPPFAAIVQRLPDGCIWLTGRAG